MSVFTMLRSALFITMLVAPISGVFGNVAMERIDTSKIVGSLAESQAVDEQLPAFVLWKSFVEPRVANFVKDRSVRKELLGVIWFESARMQVDPALILALIQVLSQFRKYAISEKGARGYMQIGEGWQVKLGEGDKGRFFHLLFNVRSGCVILRHYIDTSNSDINIALSRYLGQARNQNLTLDSAVNKKFLKRVNMHRKAWTVRAAG